MHYGKCFSTRQRFFTLKKLQERSSAQPFMAGFELSGKSVQALSQDWALRSTKKAARFIAKQKAYLEEKFKIGEQTGFKADAAQVVQDMRHTKHEDGGNRFTVDEFLAPQQIKSYFSRMTAKFRQGSHDVADEWDSQVVAEQDVYPSSRAQIRDLKRLSLYRSHPLKFA